ncbi:hypothetical protein L3Y34_012657 [Caenorhabditis briggsae]|uniref:Uncharacterized protein n=1 Tax=Caenorhabditis briggsae TaxID=6238 RepID=A0AAE9CWW1_CAEBR|nr:hypothetical protein L3Y34_012657 [Caenorhabditis briggsae]
MSVLTFDAFAYGITNFDTIGEDELSKLEATKFSQIKDIEINMKSIIQILTVIKNLENELNVSTTKFFKIPDQYNSFVSAIQAKYFPTSEPLTINDLLKFSERENIGKLILTHSIKLKYILNLDRFHNGLTLKGSFNRIPRLNGSTLAIWHHLRSVASVSSNMMVQKIPLQMFVIVLMFPLQDFFTKTGAADFKKIIFRYMGGHFAIDHKVKINAVLDADYTAHYDNEFRICLKILAQVRIDLTKACEESVKNLDFYNPNDRKEMELCVKLYYDVGFCNLAKWEVAVKILKDLFDSKNAMGSPVDSTQDVATVWNSYHSLDLDSGRNFVSNSPVNLNPVPSKSYIPPHMTRRKRNPFVKCYSTGQMLNSRLNRRVIPKSSIVDFNFNSNINQSLELNPLSNSDQYSSPYMESPPPLSVEPQIPGMYLMPKNSDAPVYKLVPDGLAPEGWQNDPAWHQNVYKIGGTIEYQGKDYQMAKTWKEL